MCGSVGKDTDGNASVLFEIDESARKRVLMAVLEDLRHSGFLTRTDPGIMFGTMHQKCLLYYFQDMYRTAEKNVSSEFNLFFMELYGILKEAIATRGYGSEGAVESLKYRIQCIISRV